MTQKAKMVTQEYTWQSIFSIIKQHKQTLVRANIIALFAAAISVPVPLLMPLLETKGNISVLNEKNGFCYYGVEKTIHDTSS